MKKVELKYLLKNRNEFIISELPLSEYFDLEEGEEIDFNSVPRYPQPYLYVGTDLSELIFVQLTITLGEETRSFKQTFWNNGKNFLTERTDIGKSNYRELILSIELDETEKRYETIRLHCGSNFIMPIYHGFIFQDNTGCESEINIDTESFKKLIPKGDILR